MFRSLSSLCLRCEARFLTHNAQSTVQTRCASQLQKKRPARFDLSKSVARPTPKSKPSAGKPRRRPNHGPFAAMNQTKPPIIPAAREPSRPERRRVSGKRGARSTGRADDFKALKMQRALANVSYERRAVIKDQIRDIGSFEDFSLLPIIKASVGSQALLSMEDASPTPIQKVAIPALLGLDGKKARNLSESHGVEEFLLAAETGSGKTLSYLLPIIHAIKAAEAQEAVRKQTEAEDRKKSENYDPFALPSPEESAAGRPRAIILLPTAELVDQVTSVAKSLCHTIKFRASGISAAYSATVIRNRVFAPGGIDILISTPHLLSSIVETNPEILSKVKHLVFDEADSLMDKSFLPITLPILERCRPSLKQHILCSATIPRGMDSYLRRRMPDIRRLTTPNLHAIPRRVQLGVVEVSKEPYHGNKDLACADAIWNIGKSAVREDFDDVGGSKLLKVIVFVNEREQTVELAKYLGTKGIDAVALNRDAPEMRGGAVLSEFTTEKPGQTTSAKDYDEPAGSTSVVPKLEFNSRGVSKTLSNVKVLVVTDIASRGIDTTAVRNVILYDVPHTTIDFIHRLGRIGRMGRRGRGVVLVGKGDRRDVVKEVREGMFRGQALI
ncbi:DEAD/DEAH box helicase [Eremomyces bilateralis CBS 781.70]|uniref:RNA helicase n=1 Tax=Eremomyces bilateralis CBS 781.70 TaxID=1392243 RepID=A0A6G1FTV4_9PEZI|nr:DEAD/DEAH box helicase [Eremomyces bilateralis CBS 781.70]KAF1809170.1 DEAD/DEAH box helicase [Eremomyces bilateralis CBS 781.70]